MTRESHAMQHDTQHEMQRDTQRDVQRDVDWPRYTSGTTMTEPHRPQAAAAYREEVAPSAATQPRRDAVRWGAVWAGLLVTLSTFILVELIFFALGWLTFDQGSTGTTAGLISALIGIVAFFVGGMVAGNTSNWWRAREGVVHGLLVWALGIVGITFLTLFGAGALLGSVANAVTQAANLQGANLPDVTAGQALSAARTAAGWAILGLLVYLILAIAGGLLGVKIGSRRRREEAASHGLR